MRTDEFKINLVLIIFIFIYFYLGFLVGGTVKEKEIISNLDYIKGTLLTQDDLDGVGGVYYGDGRIICLPNTFYCQHEVGHALDDFLGFPSETAEWKRVVDSFVEGCMEEYIDSFYCGMTEWAGINGNPFHILEYSNGDTAEWGGYGELYASIFEQSRTNLKHIPEPLASFYRLDWRGTE